MFADDMVPNPFQVIFAFNQTVGVKMGLNCSGLSYFGVWWESVKKKGG